jgi:uncharacterized protein with von Willebrand factor type A (vWA) domain
MRERKLAERIEKSFISDSPNLEKLVRSEIKKKADKYGNRWQRHRLCSEDFESSFWEETRNHENQKGP